ncbi:hypothetical protein V7S43_005599 [Phytophthora oleae]|uniref:RNase H type-1 domain-containing protein n=1 Tax=Phytophthora oleae TaxID=2107226 RepID=A0ABD3FRZ9_9STRA
MLSIDNRTQLLPFPSVRCIASDALLPQLVPGTHRAPAPVSDTAASGARPSVATTSHVPVPSTTPTPTSDATAPSAPPLTVSASDASAPRSVWVSDASGTFSHATDVFASFDGGCRLTVGQRAYAWCIWSAEQQLLRWESRSFAVAESNNAMEAQGLLSCLQWVQSNLPGRRTHVFGDSTLILQQALMQASCKAVHLRPLIAAIRSLGAGKTLFYLRHVRREYNIASDAFCNWIMDTTPPTLDHIRRGSYWPTTLAPNLALSPAVLLPFQTPLGHSVDLRAHAEATWSLVRQELGLVAHLVLYRFVPQRVDRPHHPGSPPTTAPDRVTTAARLLYSEFDTDASRSCIVAGISRCVPRGVFADLQEASRIVGADFRLATVFLAPGTGPRTTPLVGLAVLDALIADVRYGVAGTLKLFRGQTPADQRPNKALRPWLYRTHLATYS